MTNFYQNKNGIMRKNSFDKINENFKINIDIKNDEEMKNIRKFSIASMTDDEILAFQTPDKKEDINILKFSPNTVSRKNLMELFKQIKKNEL